MLKSDVLDLNGENNTASNLCELAAQHYSSLHPFQGGRSELTCRSTMNTAEEEEGETYQHGNNSTHTIALP
jgi:hypothetical protein